jgi:hypothetical protein
MPVRRRQSCVPVQAARVCSAALLHQLRPAGTCSCVGAWCAIARCGSRATCLPSGCVMTVWQRASGGQQCVAGGSVCCGSTQVVRPPGLRGSVITSLAAVHSRCGRGIPPPIEATCGASISMSGSHRGPSEPPAHDCTHWRSAWCAAAGVVCRLRDGPRRGADSRDVDDHAR